LEVIGQEHVVQTLTNAIASGAVSHAYLFAGPRGSGKTTLARIFAKAVNCRGKGKTKPCNACDSCLEISASKAIDLVEIDAASHTGVDDVRELIEGIKFAPAKTAYKVFIIDECHQLSKAASNALLKTLEEPPAHALFLLATTEAHKMLPTIISRCQRFDFKRLHAPEIIKKLEFICKQEGVACEKPALSLIALNARGSFRDAESLLDKCIQFSGKDGNVKAQEVKDLLGIVEIGQVAEFMDFILAKNAKQALAFLQKLADQGVDLQEFAKTIIFYLRVALLAKINPALAKDSGLSDEETQLMAAQAAKLEEKTLQKMLELFIAAENNMKYAPILSLPLELAVVELTVV
jgi:DNA polymerase-3 subunit gamma/tau